MPSGASRSCSCSATPTPASCPGCGCSRAAPSTTASAGRRARATPFADRRGAGAPRCADPRARGGGRDRAAGRRRPAARGRAGSRPRSSRCASTPASTSRSPLPHSPPRPDGWETVDAQWFAPRRALDAHAADEIELVFPTIKHLESLLPYASSREVLDAVGIAGRAGPPEGDRRGRGAAHRSAGRPDYGYAERSKIRRTVTSTLPQDVRDVFERFVDLRVHDARLAPAADHVARHPLLPLRRADDRRHDRAGLSEEGRWTRGATPGWRSFLRPDRLRDRVGDPGAGSRDRRKSTTATCRPTASATGASRWRSSRRRETCTRLGRCGGCSAGTTPGYTSRCGPSGCSSGRRAIRASSPPCSTRTSRRCGRGTSRSRNRRRHPRRRLGRLGSANRGARAAPPDGGPCVDGSRRLPARAPRPRAAGTDRQARVGRRRAGRAAPARGPRVPHRPRPLPRLLVAGELPGARRPRARPTDGWSLTSRIG